MRWNPAMMPRAPTSKGTPPSIAAMVTVSDFVRLSLLVVKRRAIVQAEGMRFNVSASALSARFRRVAHSLTTRRDRESPVFLNAAIETVSNLRSYDTIYLGFPIWGMTAPPIIRSFLSRHD
jgi:hypothetical protein